MVNFETADLVSDGKATGSGAEVDVLSLWREASTLARSQRQEQPQSPDLPALVIHASDLNLDRVADKTNSQARPIEASKAISLGVEPASWQSIKQQDPALFLRMREISNNGLSNSNVNLDGISASATTYKFDVMAQAVTKFGSERVRNVLDGLVGMSAGNASGLQRQLKVDNFSSPERMNRRLANVVALCEDGGLEDAQRLHKLLESEGSKTALTLDQINRDNIQLLLSNPEERKAMIEFANEASKNKQGSDFLGAHPEYDYTKGKVKPSETLAAFRRYQAMQ